MKTVHILWNSFFLLSGLFGGLYAQPEVAPIVREIVIRGNVNVSDTLIRSQIETKVGNPLREEVINEDLRKLYKLGYLSDISVLQEDVADGIRLVFQVRENRIISELILNGNRKVADSEIREVLQSKAGRDQFFNEYLVILDKENIINLYQSKGFLFIEISYRIELVEEGVRLTFDIIEGNEVSIEEIKFEGNYTFKKSTLTGYMLTKENGWFFTTGYYNPRTFSEDLVILKNYYRSEGYIDAECYLGDVQFNEEKDRITLVVVVQEGFSYKVDQLEISGNQLFTAKEIQNRLKVLPQKIFKTPEIGEDIQTIQKMYGENAYADVDIDYEITFREGGNQVGLAYKIKENQKSYLNEVIIQGNTQTKDKVLRREVTLAPGAAMNTTELEDSAQRLRNLRYFSEVDLSYQESDVPGHKDAVYRVTEGKTGSLRLAAGITSNSGFVGSVSFVKRNFDAFDIPRSWDDFLDGSAFTGAGQTLTLSFQPSEETVLFNIGWEEPYLFDRPYELGINLFLSQTTRRTYDENRLGTSISIGKRFQRDMALDLAIRWELVQIEDLDFDAPSNAFDVEGDNYFSSIALRYTWDKRDEFILPSKGYIFNASAELATKTLGGDFDFIKYTASYTRYLTLHKQLDGEKHILSVGGKVGYAEPFGSTKEVPIFERFFAGGLNSVRGFEYRSLGPQEFGESIGGEAIYLGTIEYTFPLYEKFLRGVLFVDAGNISETIYDSEFDDYRASYGFGFLISLPAVLGPRPLSLNFGFPLVYNEEDDLRIFSFSVGRN